MINNLWFFDGWKSNTLAKLIGPIFFNNTLNFFINNIHIIRMMHVDIKQLMHVSTK